jgi:hypothetical protein
VQDLAALLERQAVHALQNILFCLSVKHYVYFGFRDSSSAKKSVGMQLAVKWN